VLGRFYRDAELHGTHTPALLLSEPMPQKLPKQTWSELRRLFVAGWTKKWNPKSTFKDPKDAVY
jgi:hypothetical protein